MISLNKLSLGFMKDTKSYVLKLKAVESDKYSSLNLGDIVNIDFPDNQYMREQTKKNQIVLHHTVSGSGGPAVANWWNSTPERVATAIVVDRFGVIYQLYSSEYWAHHLGLHMSNNTALNKASIGIEIDSWGALMELNGKWYPVKWDAEKKKMRPNTSLRPISNVQKYDKCFKGFYGFEKYTLEQIESVRKLLIFWNEKYGIPLVYNEDMWNISQNALSGKPGIWTHVSYREDKSDCHPDDGLIQMLKSLK